MIPTGDPEIIKTDNAKSETLGLWREHCWKHCIDMQTSEPNHQHQNPVESHIGELGSMVKRVMHEFQVSAGKFDWVMKWCCDVHNVLACRSLKWRTPLELSTGNTPDISKF